MTVLKFVYYIWPHIVSIVHRNEIRIESCSAVVKNSKAYFIDVSCPMLIMI